MFSCVIDLLNNLETKIVYFLISELNTINLINNMMKKLKL